MLRNYLLDGDLMPDLGMHGDWARICGTFLNLTFGRLKHHAGENGPQNRKEKRVKMFTWTEIHHLKQMFKRVVLFFKIVLVPKLIGFGRASMQSVLA